MRGDFSAWNKDRSHNFRGTLHQQGRVLLDRDWNAQTEVMGEWQETAARDAFGAEIAAVPAEIPDSFKVVQATSVPTVDTTPAHVEISLKKGRVWADGLLAELGKDAEPPTLPAGVDAIRTATYLGPPIQTAPLADAVPAIGDRDAVILEAWLEELSPFQNPELLIEPALGGVDTTERVQTAMRVRMYRMAEGETCDSIIDKVKDDFSKKGRLQVELKPTAQIDGDCPVVESGGFTGFEHRLYRIEIADTDRANQSWFKWSHFNGGLVGTGDFDAVNKKVTIIGNKNAIVNSGLNSFYLEALDLDPNQGYWKVIYGAKALLASDGTLTLPDPAVNSGDIFKGAIPPALPNNRKRFFRLWNGIERVATFAAALLDLPDNLGIVLRFEPDGAGKYTPSDFWTFEVRAGGIGNPPVLVGIPPVMAGDPVTPVPPQGIFYHRVPLAEVHWTGNTVAGVDIEDCRLPFQPLTKLKTCCTYRVGNGIHSHGDFKTVQAAINALPKTGGEVCVLPGTYNENVVIDPPHNRNVIIKGCGRRTVIRAVSDKPAIHVKYGQGITIESLAVEAHEEGIGILLEGEPMETRGQKDERYLMNVTLSELFVAALQKSGIKAHTAQNLTLSRSVVYILENQFARYPAVYLAGDDMLIERTEIRVLPKFGALIGESPRISSVLSSSSSATLGELLEAVAKKAGSKNPFFSNDPENFVVAEEALGGLQIAGGSERVRILDNLIIGGRGNGISLGNVDLVKDGKVVTNHDPFTPVGDKEDCCKPGDDHFDDGDENDEGYRPIAGPPLYDILIKFNRILNMGRNGIGLASAFSLGEDVDLSDKDIPEDPENAGLIFVSRLVIDENRIERCMRLSPDEIGNKDLIIRGYGGISLAIVEDLLIRDNFLVDNCRDYHDPICGIFVLVTFGAEISRNEIVEHLPQDYLQRKSTTVRTGARGGIWILLAVGQMDIFNYLYDKYPGWSAWLERFSDAHAVKIHQNVVSTPMGRCLTTMVIGDASILGNRFTSFGVQPVDVFGLIKLLTANEVDYIVVIMQLMSLVATNVLILDLGSLILFTGYHRLIRSGGKADAVSPGVGDEWKAAYRPQNARDQNVEILTKSGLISFADNQCKFNPRGGDLGIALSSVFIVGLADQGFHDNQISCDMPRTLMVSNAALIGGTLRVTGNYFRENVDHVAYSAGTYGLLNITSDNESVHCLLVLGEQFLNRFNLVLRAMAFGLTGNIMTDTSPQGGKPLVEQLEDFCRDSERRTKLFSQMWSIALGRTDTSDLSKFGVKSAANG